MKHMCLGKRQIFFLLILFLYVLSAFALSEKMANPSDQCCTLELELIGGEYDKIQLIIMDNNQVVHPIDGAKVGAFNWKFVFSDSLYAISVNMQLSVPTATKQELYMINLHLLTQDNDTIRKNVFNVSPNSKYVAVKYRQHTVKKFQFYGGKDVTFDSYIVSDKKKTDFTLAALSPFTRINKKDTINYNADLDCFISSVNANKDSHFLLMELESSLFNLKSKEDASLVYESFGDGMKQSIIGRKINQYLYEKKIVNMRLINSETGVYEPILSNNDKYVLILFSASWCPPCHKQIPLLKKIYKDLAPDIELVYISIDEMNTVGAWRKLMSDESISWKSFLALGTVPKVKEAYFVQYIPFSYLVYPDQSFEIIDVRNEVDLRKLYDLCGHLIDN